MKCLRLLVLAGTMGLTASAGCGADETWRPSGLAYARDSDPPADVIDLFDDMVPVPDDARPAGRTLGFDEPHVFYMNFSEGTDDITKGPDNARTNTSRICGISPYPRWTGAAGCGDRDMCRAAISNIVQEQWQDFNIVLVTKRPADSVEYSMEMIGPTGPGCSFPAGVGGIAPFDCGNRNEADVCYAFLCNGSPKDCAVIISQEEAHTFGLAHTNDSCDILYPTVSKCDKPVFADKANSVNGMGCGGGTQNSYQVLKQALGTWPAGKAHPRDWEDCLSGPPTVTITSPLDGDAVDPTFKVTAAVASECDVRSVKITLVGADKVEKEAKNPPFEWMIDGLARGDYLVKVAVVGGDTMMQTAEASIAVHVDQRTACKADDECGPAGKCFDGFCKLPRPPSTGCALAPGSTDVPPGAPPTAALSVLALVVVGRRRRR